MKHAGVIVAGLGLVVVAGGLAYYASQGPTETETIEALKAAEERVFAAEARADNAEAVAEGMAGKLRECETRVDRAEKPEKPETCTPTTPTRETCSPWLSDLWTEHAAREWRLCEEEKRGGAR